ncbi:MAG: NAD-binding protein [Actinomycetota bacterium]
MKVIVAGCGRVGSSLANRLSMEGHDVAVVDKDPTSFERLGKTFKGITVKGFVFDGEALKKAGIERADAFISVTSGDNSNVVAATIAKDIYRVPKVVARIYEPRRAEIYRRLGIPTVSTVTWASNEILTLVLHTEITTEATFGDGEVQLARIEIPPRLVGRTVDDISIPGEILISAIVRGGKSFIPTAGAVFQEHDLVKLVVLTTALPKLKRMLAP